MRLDLAQVFFQRAARQPHQPVVLGPDPQTRISFGELREQVRDLAARLGEAGITPGMNVALHHPSGVDYIALTYALWAAGACVTPIPMELAQAEKRQIFRDIAIHGLITLARAGASLEPVGVQRETLLAGGFRVLLLRPQCEVPAGLAALNPAFIRFTSGTTGQAKGVVLSHESIFQRIQAANEVLHIGSDDRVVWLLSMAYHFAVSIVAYLSFGATIVLPRNAFGVSILEAANRHRATLIYGAPTHYELMTHHRDHQLPALRLAIVTTARLPVAIAEGFLQRFGIPLNETYGIIEVGLPAINVRGFRDKPASVGRLSPAYQLKLVPQPGEVGGEVWLKGPGMLDAYYRPWRHRDRILQDGWLATGDLGVLDADGYLSLVGRSKDLISVAGMKFFPQEVEQVLERHPAIRAACVFGAKAARTGETPVARLVPVAGATLPDGEALRAYCARHLAGYKIPSRFIRVERLDYTASGKLIRNAERLAHPTTTTSPEAHGIDTSTP